MSSEDKYNQVQLMTMSAIDFLDQWFETDVLKATMSASGIIGTFLGVRSPGTAYVLLHHYMGEIDGAFRSWGFSRGAPVPSPMRSQMRPANWARKSGRKRRSQRLLSRTTARKASCCKMAMKFTAMLFHPALIRGLRSSSSLKKTSCRENFWKMCGV